MYIYKYNQEGLVFLFDNVSHVIWGFPGGSDGKEPVCNAEDLGLIPGSEKAPGEGTGNPLQYSCLGNPMERRAWPATIHGITNSRIGLSN